MQKGDVIDAPSEQWIANRAADGGLVEAIADAPVVESASVDTPAETATINSAPIKARRKG